MTPRPTGRAALTDGQPSVVFERAFRAPIKSVWAAVTESDRLERWFGTWTGDPASGSVLFQTNAEGEAPPSTYEIVRCEPPRVLQVKMLNDYGDWDLRLALRVESSTTVLALTQVLTEPKLAEDTGPGWEYYLDRLVAAKTGASVAAVDWDADYYPAMREYYRAVVEELTYKALPSARHQTASSLPPGSRRWNRRPPGKSKGAAGACAASDWNPRLMSSPHATSV